MNREIKDEEIVVLITKYLRDHGYAKTLKTLQKETTQLNIDYSEIDSIRDLKWILNDYFRLRSEEIGKQELSHSLSLSYGPEIERMYKQLETILSDYSQYRKIIENQLNCINETYETPASEPVQNEDLHSAYHESEDNNSQIADDQLNDLDLPMEQYLHLYRTLPTILPDVINQTLNKNQVIDCSDAAIDSIIDSLQEKSAFGEIIPPPPVTNTNGDEVQNKPVRRTSRKTTPRKLPEESSFVSKRQNQGDS